MRVEARKDGRRWHFESEEQQMARLYPSNQPRVFSRLWSQASKRKNTQEIIDKLEKKSIKDKLISRLQEVNKTIYSKMADTMTNLDTESSHNMSLSQSYIPHQSLNNHKIKFSKNLNLLNNKTSSCHRIDVTKIQRIGLKTKTDWTKPQKSSFITDFVRSHLHKPEVEVHHTGNGFNVSTQTDIDDDMLNEIIDKELNDLPSYGDSKINT